ncbi:hypothetical protein GQ41_3935 [Arenibacter algicola]|uniref:Transposase n=1 Tax=Arenibacter algicola TaxID=616991 RepID=A0ABY3AEQ3_9FLAO
MRGKYKFQNPTAAYFVSFATVYWIDVFTRQTYFSILLEAMEHCRTKKGIESLCLLFYAQPPLA